MRHSNNQLYQNHSFEIFKSIVHMGDMHVEVRATFRSQFFPCGSRVLNSSYQTCAQCFYPLDSLTSPGALFLQFFVYGDSSCPSRTPLCQQFLPKDLFLLCHPIRCQPFLRYTKIIQTDLLCGIYPSVYFLHSAALSPPGFHPPPHSRLQAGAAPCSP